MYAVNISMETDLLIAHGNTYREQHKPEEALACYAQAFVQDFNSASAFNNYGNVLRELGYPERAIPFLQNAIAIDPKNETAKFNLAVSYLLQGNYKLGWPAYEDRWNFEHLKGQLPNLPQPRWAGESLKDKSILVIGEQGIGDTIQFSRFLNNLIALGAKPILAIDVSLATLFKNSNAITIVTLGSEIPHFDYWTPIMSIPGILGLTLDNLNSPLTYIDPDTKLVNEWQKRLGFRKKLRIGFSWAGRRDTWIHQHKSVPFKYIVNLIKNNNDYEWVNLQIDANEEESRILTELGCATYPGTIASLADSAALISCMDVVVSVDTAVSHLSAAMGKTTWIMLNHYGVDWRWLLNRADSPWYPSARLYRQPSIGNWEYVTNEISKQLKLFKI